MYTKGEQKSGEKYMRAVIAQPAQIGNDKLLRIEDKSHKVGGGSRASSGLRASESDGHRELMR